MCIYLYKTFSVCIMLNNVTCIYDLMAYHLVLNNQLMCHFLRKTISLTVSMS